MIFCDSFIPHKCQPIFDQNFDRRDVYIITQNALADPTYLQYIRSQYFRSAETNYDTPFFQEVLRGKEEHDKYSQYYGTNFLARIGVQAPRQARHRDGRARRNAPTRRMRVSAEGNLHAQPGGFAAGLLRLHAGRAAAHHARPDASERAARR